MCRSAFPSGLTKLSELQNKAIRIATGKNWNDSANPLNQKLDVLLSFSLLDYKIAKFVYQHDKSKLPASFSNHFTLPKNVLSRRTQASCNNQLKIPFFEAQKKTKDVFNTLVLKFGTQFQF